MVVKLRHDACCVANTGAYFAGRNSPNNFSFQCCILRIICALKGLSKLVITKTRKVSLLFFFIKLKINMSLIIGTRMKWALIYIKRGVGGASRRGRCKDSSQAGGDATEHKSGYSCKNGNTNGWTTNNIKELRLCKLSQRRDESQERNSSVAMHPRNLIFFLH